MLVRGNMTPMIKLSIIDVETGTPLKFGVHIYLFFSLDSVRPPPPTQGPWPTSLVVCVDSLSVQILGKGVKKREYSERKRNYFVKK